MYLPPKIYELLPYGYVVGGASLAVASWLRPRAGWSDAALVVGFGVLVFGLVLLMRRRTYRADASQYDGRSIDDA